MPRNPTPNRSATIRKSYSDNQKTVCKTVRIRFVDTYLQNLLKQALVNSSLDFNIYDSFSYVDYEEGGFIGLHIDGYDEAATHTMIVYLNDDYKGGKTYTVDNNNQITKINKKVGKGFIFEGRKVPHGSYIIREGRKRVLLCKLY